MGLILKIEEVHEHLAAFNLLTPELQETLVYAQVMPSTGQWHWKQKSQPKQSNKHGKLLKVRLNSRAFSLTIGMHTNWTSK